MNRLLSSIFFCLLLAPSVFLVSCSEDSEEEGEFDNWKRKNEVMTEQWASNSSYRKIKTYSKNESTTASTKSSDFIYVEVLESGSGAGCPLFTDTVRVAYRGHYIPTQTYPEGLVFDQSYIEEFSWDQAGVSAFAVQNLVEGFGTALMNMHVGDRWRVRMPYQLGYGSGTNSNSIYAYSNLVFEIALYDYWHPGEKRSPYKSR